MPEKYVYYVYCMDLKYVCRLKNLTELRINSKFVIKFDSFQTFASLTNLKILVSLLL